MVPVTVRLAAPLLPAVKDRPEVEPKLSVPCVTPSARLAMWLPPPSLMSTSLNDRALPPSAENGRSVSSATVCAPGTLATGASFTEVTFKTRVLWSTGAEPPTSAPLSTTSTCIASTPLKFRAPR